MPLQGEHHHHQGSRLDQAGDNADKSVADRALRSDHIVVETADQLAYLGVRIKAQRHALQVGKQRPAQVVDHAFAHPGVELPEPHVQPAGQQGNCQHGYDQIGQSFQIALRKSPVDQVPQDQRGQQG